MPIITGMITLGGAAVSGRAVRAYRRDTGALLRSTRSSDGVSLEGDPSYSDVALLLQGEGVTALAAIRDRSSAPKTLSVPGTVVFSDLQSRQVWPSLRFQGGGLDYIQAAQSTAFNFGTGAFTIEAWVLIPTGITGPYAAICDIRSSSGAAGHTLMMLNTARQLGYYSFTEIRTTNTIPLNTWTHVAMSRSGGVTRLFIGGVLGASVNDTDNKITNPCFIGRVQDGAWPAFTGFIDDLRVTKGVGRYTANFTPPTAPFTAHSVPAAPLALGAYRIDTPFTGEVQVVCLDDAAGPVYNDLILRTTPV